MIANKVKTEADQAAIEQFCEQYKMPIIGSVPYEEEFMEAERKSMAPIDYAPNSTGAAAIKDIAEVLKKLNAPGNENMDLPSWKNKTKPAACTPNSGLNQNLTV